MAEASDELTDPKPDPVPYQSGVQAAAIVARAGGEYRFKRLALVILIGGYGLWSLYDGTVKMPRDNAEFRQKNPMGGNPPHPDWDIPFNLALGYALPPLALALLAWSMYSSRGQIRLDPDDTLYAPGHPPVPLSAVTAVDRGRWDRKGIALIDYQLSGDDEPGRIRLDDFVYQRQPTDLIFDRVMAAVAGPAADEPVAATDVPLGGPDVDASDENARRL